MLPGPALEAGITDDNVSWDAYLRYHDAFLRTGQAVLDLPVDGRETIAVVDAAGHPILGAGIVVENAAGAAVGRLQTHADGRALFAYPATLAPSAPPDHYTAIVTKGGATTTVALAADTDSYRVALPLTVAVDASAPVQIDVQFLIDATGSMGPDIDRLKNAIVAIASQIEALPTHPDLRLGVTLYRDRGDLFTTRTFGLTPDVAAFAAALGDVQAAGGGDTPEDVQAGLADALAKPGWRGDDTIKLVFLIGDAPPHLYPDEVSYADSVRTAVGSGVKIVPVATSALDDVGRFVFRQLAQQTSGRFVAIGGAPSGATASNASGDAARSTDATPGSQPLEQVIVRLVGDEVAARSM